MPRRHPDDMEGVALAPLCVAGNTREAERIEVVLDREGVDYTFDIVMLAGGSGLFGSPKQGVMFLVPSEQEARLREVMVRAGHAKLLIEEKEE